MKDSEEILKLTHLKKYYKDIRGIEDVSLSLKKGDVYGFIGPNGAGKSTTIRTIMGLINKTSGDIYIKGKEYNKNDIETKKIIGYLPSEINLYGDFTVKEMLDYHESFYNKDTHNKRKELVKLLKIEEGKKIEDLSLGNLKKVGLALALIHEPEILILDEPTSGLDPIMQNNLYDILLKEKEKGTTIIYSTHILSEVSKICDHIGFIKEGKIIKEDTIENIKKDNYTYLTIESKEIDKIKKEFNLKIINEHNNTIKYINNLSAMEIINKLSKYNIDKLLIEEITLEDLFMHYYK